MLYCLNVTFFVEFIMGKLIDWLIAAHAGHSRGRGLLRFSSGSPSPAGLHTRPPGQVQWVSEQWSPPIAVSTPSPLPIGLLSKNAEAASQDVRLFSLSPPVPSHSTPTLSLHSKDLAGLYATISPATADHNPPVLFHSLRSSGKRAETHSAAVNGDIPLMTSASDPLPAPSNVAPGIRSHSPSPVYTAKAARASPHHDNIQPAQSHPPTLSPVSHLPSSSPVSPVVPVGLVSLPSLASSVKSPHVTSASAGSSSVQSALSPVAPLFVPQHCSASKSLVSIRLFCVIYLVGCILACVCVFVVMYHREFNVDWKTECGQLLNLALCN